MGRKKKKQFFKRWYIKWSARLIVLLFLLVVALIGSVYFGLWGKLPTKDALSDLSQMQASLVYDKNQTLIGKFYITNRESIAFEELPNNIINALVATEDVRFFEHDGIDERSLFRVAIKTILLSDESSGGGSTITMQLAKNLFGRKDYGEFGIVINKIRESIIALRLESIYTKNEILTLYLNTVPFSGNVYGIESASQKFFNKKAKELTLLEAATLVGTLKANHYYNPRLYLKRAKTRRNTVLKQMTKYGYLSSERYDTIKQKDIVLHYQSNSSQMDLGAYFKTQVKQKAEEILLQKKYRKKDGTPYQLLKDGLRIYTTLDATLQKYAEHAMHKHMAALQAVINRSYGKNAPWNKNSEVFKKVLHQLPLYQMYKDKGWSKKKILDSLRKKQNREIFTWDNGDTVLSISVLDSLSQMMRLFTTGMIAVNPHTGAIEAYIGGINHNFFKYDHVVQSKREVGSTFKPFVYTAAVENGVKPNKYFPIQEVTYTDQDGWTPSNAGEKNDPAMNYSMEAALSHSINTIAVKVLKETGIDKTIDLVHRMGIKEHIEPVPSIALGVTAIPLIDMAKAYTTYLNHSVPVAPYFIEKIEDVNGNVIYKRTTPPSLEKVYDERTRQIMMEMLKDVVNNGTAKRLRTRYHLSNALAGKTGTTQNNTDGWFVGLMPGLVTVTWVGNDNHDIKFRTTRVGQGANSALPIFAQLVQKMNKDKRYNHYTKVHFFPPKEEIVKLLDCPPTKRDGFFRRIFNKKHKEESFEKKKSFFQRLFGSNKDEKE